MKQDTREISHLILKLINNKKSFFFWFALRFVSALFPIWSIYLFSEVISLLENNHNFNQIISLVILLLIVYFLDNFTRLLSIYKLEYIISGIQFDVHNFLIPGLEIKDKNTRFEGIQSVRNFSEATRLTLELIRQPGIDSVVSLLFTPLILYFLDFKIFVVEIAYIVIYYFVDVYTTQRYVYLKNLQNAKIEGYYARLHVTNDVELEEKQFNRVHKKICNWSFIEWSFLDNISVFFYILVLAYLVFAVLNNYKSISDLVLIIGYMASTQTFLNSLSVLKDKLADTKVALYRLVNNKTIDNVDLNDLIR
jgi:ABC-type multidrug transport system fused ATPase/permease subunit